MTLTDLYIYPIKSLGGIRLAEAVVEARGLRHDRRWLLVDEHSRFLTQRTDATMARLAVAIEADELVVRHRARPELGEVRVPLTAPDAAPMDVVIWDDTVPALPVSAAADAWLSAALNRPVRLVYMPDTTRRAVDPDRPDRTPPGSVVSFADAFPFLVIGQASLDHLNARLAARDESPVPMNRFRPNLVFSGGGPHDEDRWGDFRVGDIAFRGVKACARCVVVTIDQTTAQAGKEPLRTLSQYRRDGAKVNFGQDAVALGTGVVRVGEEVVSSDE